MTSFEKASHTTKWIAVKNLSVIWAQAQRPLDEGRVDRIAAEFDPDLFDEPVVTQANGNGIYHVVDGQHRRAAIHKLFGDNEQVPCRVVDAKDPARAAEIFDLINNSRKAPSAVEKFNVRVTAGRGAECAIHKIVAGLGYRIAGHRSDSTIRAVAALTNVYRKHGAEVLKEALITIKGTWNNDINAFDGPIITGYGLLIGEHRGHLDWVRLRSQVAKTYTPGQLLGRGKYHAESERVSVAAGIKHVLVRTYDHGLRAGKLER